MRVLILDGRTPKSSRTTVLVLVAAIVGVVTGSYGFISHVVGY